MQTVTFFFVTFESLFTMQHLRTFRTCISTIDILSYRVYILTLNVYILAPNVYILTSNSYILSHARKYVLYLFTPFFHMPFQIMFECKCSQTLLTLVRHEFFGNV
jgi:hypothetical protein